MSDEPAFKKLVKGWLMKFSGDPDRDARQLIESMPMDMLQTIRRNPQDAPLVKRLVKGWLGEQHAKIDTRMLEAVTAQLTAGEKAWAALEAAMRAKHKALGLPDTLEREDELSHAEHDTKMMEHQARQAALSPNPLQRTLEEERLHADIAEQRARRAQFGEGDVERQVREAVGQIRNKSDLEARLNDALKQFGSGLSDYERERIKAILRNELSQS